MELQRLIKETKCPTCGCTTVIREEWYRENDGGFSETREFDCGYAIYFETRDGKTRSYLSGCGKKSNYW